MKKYLFVLILFLISAPAFSITISGQNVPYDSSFHLGLVNGPGSGVDIGLDIFYPLGWIELGGDLEQQVTNSDLEQNLNILKFGLAAKYNVNDDFYITFHLGRAQFYVANALSYNDSLSGTQYDIPEDTHGSATYWAVCPCFRIGEYYIMPKAVLNSVTDGGNIFEFDLDLGHKF